MVVRSLRRAEAITAGSLIEYVCLLYQDARVTNDAGATRVAMVSSFELLSEMRRRERVLTHIHLVRAGVVEDATAVLVYVLGVLLV